MNTTENPDALQLADIVEQSEGWTAYKAAAELRRQHARIAELEAVLSAMGEKGNPVEPADIPRATDQDTHFFLAGWNGRAAQVDPHEHFRNAAATAPAYPAEGVPAQTTRDAVIQHLTNAGVLEHDGCGIFIASGDASELIDACMALSTHAHHEKGAAAQAVALLATGGQAQAVERIAIDMKQTAELLDLFGGEPTEFTVMQCNGHSGPGLYAYVTEYPEDGASYLGKTDCEAQPAPKAQAAASTAGHGLEQFIEQVGDVHFQRCRVGSKEGAIRWDIEFGHYGDEVRGKTLREAITKAIATKAKQGGM